MYMTKFLVKTQKKYVYQVFLKKFLKNISFMLRNKKKNKYGSLANAVPLNRMKELLATLVALDDVVKNGNVYLEKDFK